MKVIRTVLVEDETLVRDLLSMALSENRRFELVAQASDGETGLALCKEHQPDLVLLDMMMPKVGGAELAMQLLEILPDVRLLALSSRSDSTTVQSAIRMGIHGYMVKRTSMDVLLQAMATVADGGQYFDQEVLGALASPVTEDGPSLDRLTKREVEILREVARGRSVKEISSMLFISENTVKMHRQNLMKKLAIHDVVGLTHFAIKHGLITV